MFFVRAGFLVFLPILLSACALPPATPYGPARPIAPAKSSRWNGVFSCTAHVDGKLPVITWTRVPFRQEGDRLSGLYTFTDHFKHQNSVVFSGTLSGQSARASVTAVRTDGAPNFTAEVSGTRP